MSSATSGRRANHNTAALALRRLLPREVVQLITRNVRDTYYRDLQTLLSARALRHNTLYMSLRRLLQREVVDLITRTSSRADYIHRKAQRILKTFLWSARWGWLPRNGVYQLPLRMHSERQMTEFARSTGVFHWTTEFENATWVGSDESWDGE